MKSGQGCKQSSHLRLLTECFILVVFAMFGEPFNLVTNVRLPYFLEHWMIVTTKQLFLLQELLAKWRQSFVKNSFKKTLFLSKSSKFCTYWTIWIGSNFTSMWSKYISNNVRRDFYLLRAHGLIIFIKNKTCTSRAHN